MQTSSAESGIQSSIVNDKVQIALNTAGLSHGFHAGVVRLTVTVGSDPLIGLDAQGAGCIRVNAWVLPADDGYEQWTGIGQGALPAADQSLAATESTASI